MHHLTVVRDFGNYKRGDHIDDDAEVARILKGEHCHHVVKVIADAKPKESDAVKTATKADLPAPSTKAGE